MLKCWHGKAKLFHIELDLLFGENLTPEMLIKVSKLWIVQGQSGGVPLGNFEILHALKCVLQAPEALFVLAHSTYIPIYTCKLPFSISGFQIKKYKSADCTIAMQDINLKFASAS